MLFPAALSLAASRKNIYGVMPPADDDLLQIESLLLQDERAWLADREVSADGQPLQLARYDGLSKLNSEEREFAKALDHADFVTWWHRNPDRKPWSVRLVRGEHQNYFYPDFVICLSHYPGDVPLLRLVETKENVKDAARKARRGAANTGEGVLLSPPHARLRGVADEGHPARSGAFAVFHTVRRCVGGEVSALSQADWEAAFAGGGSGSVSGPGGSIPSLANRRTWPGRRATTNISPRESTRPRSEPPRNGREGAAAGTNGGTAPSRAASPPS